MKPCSFELSSRTISSLRVIDLSDTGALSTLAWTLDGVQWVVFLISSALESRRSQLLRSLALSRSLLACLTASMYNSAAKTAFLNASSLVGALSTLDSAP